MANDQISIPIDLRPVNINRPVTDEPRISVGRNAEGYYPNSGTSPRSRSLFYPVTVSESGYGPGLGYPNNPAMGAAWYPHQPAPIVFTGGGYTPGNRVGGNVGDPDDVSEDSNSNSGSASGKKVKFLCSFGGKILPRPSDGSLRYVGGQTRIISMRRDVSFNEMLQKMTEAYGQSVVVKYQLPEEDLDALVSISCTEDLENMMDEYGKLVENSSEGSAKLRLFLFSPAELDQSGLMQLSDLHDSGQKYVDAVNGVHDVGGGKLTRRGSTASATSTQNSDSLISGGDIGDSSGVGHVDGGGLPSPTVLSPKITSDAASRVVYVGPNPVMYAENPTVTLAPAPVLTGPPPTSVPQSELARSALALAQQQQSMLQQQQPLGYELQRPLGLDFQPSPATSYMQAYVDPHQEAYSRVDHSQISSPMGYINPQHYGMAVPYYRRVDHPQQIADTTSGYSQLMHQVHMTTIAPPSPHMNIRPINGAQQFMHPHQARVSPYPEENFYGARVVQLPADQIHRAYQPLPQQVPTQLPGGGYEWRQVSPSEHVVFSNGWAPNQHQAIQEKTLRLEDCYMCQKALPHAHSDTVVHDFGDSPSSSTSDSNLVFHSLQTDDNMRIRPQNRVAVGGALEQGTIEHQGARVVRNIDQDAGSPQLGVVGFSESPKVQPGHENVLLQKQETPDHRMLAGMGLTVDVNSPYGAFVGNSAQAYQGDVVRQPMMNQPGSTDTASYMKVVPFQTHEPLVHEHATQPYGKHPDLLPKEDILEVNGRMEAFHLGPPNLSDKELSHQLRREEIQDTPQMMRKDLLMTNAVNQPGVSDGNPAKQVEPVESIRVTEPMSSGVSEPYTDLGTTTEYKASEMWQGEPSLLGVDSAYATDRVAPLDEWKNETSHYPSRMISNNTAAITPGGISPSALSPSSGAIGDCRDPALSNSLFSNQDPWTLRHGTHFPPPRPSKIPTNKETFVAWDEQVVQQQSGNLNKDKDFEQGRCIKEENIRQELQAVAEDVAASVLQPSLPYDFSANEMSKPIEEVNECEVPNDDVKRKSMAELEDSKTKEKISAGIPISDGIGRLQIIKNSDLEELRELGSGTFGTVYHGKWRGTDVAIKRINERCFVGKPSEQDRMRNDFWNEAIKLADLHHPNVVAFYGVVVDGPGGSVATVTEYMVNGSLRQAFQRNDRTLDKRKRIMIAMDVAFGMEYLHGKNIVHFDLKSDNLLVNLRDPHRPICKVGDLGLSKVKCHTLISGGVRGTLPWMAPELLNGSSNLVSEKVDVFSFGIVMWELLTGEEPYADLHYGAIIGGIVSNTLRPAVPESCDSDWGFLMERCWSSEPSERPNFTGIANELRSMAASLPPKGQSPTQQAGK